MVLMTSQVEVALTSLLGWWMVLITVRPLATMFRMTFMTSAAARESSPDVGSSRKMIGALDTSSTPMVSTCSHINNNPVRRVVGSRRGLELTYLPLPG